MGDGDAAGAKLSAPAASVGNRYAAFISYSHTNEKVANDLHRKLENYQVPSALASKRKTANRGRRLGRFFRDRVELSAARDLKSEIREALERSDALIVLCSPEAARSQYVNEEIRYFKELGRGDAILAVIASGEPHAAGKLGRAPAEECFPPALLHRLGPDNIISSEPEGLEPIAADIRAGKDGLENGALKLIAGLLDVGLDELVQREKQAESRRRLVARGIFALVTTLAVVAGIVGFVAYEQANVAREQRAAAIEQRDVAVYQRNEALRRQSQFLAAASLSATDSGDTGTGLALALEALPTSASDRPLEPSALRALYAAWFRNREVGVVRNLHSIPAALIGGAEGEMAVSRTSESELSFVRAADGRVAGKLAIPAETQAVASCRTGLLAVATPEKIEMHQVPQVSNAVRGSIAAEGVESIWFDNACTRMAVAAGGRVDVFDTETWARVFSAEVSITGVSQVYIDPLRNRLITIVAGTSLYYFGSHGRDYDYQVPMKIWELDTGNPLAMLNGFEEEISVSALSESGALLAVGSASGVATLYDIERQQIVGRFDYGAPIRALAISERLKLWGVGGDNNTVELIGLPNNEAFSARYRHEAPVGDIAISPSQPMIASAGADNRALLFQIGTEKAVPLVGHSAPLRSVAFSTSGDSLITTADDDTLRVWNLGQIPSAKLLGVHPQRIYDAVPFADNVRFLTADREGNALGATLALWDTDKGELVARRQLEGNDAMGVAVAPGDSYVAARDTSPSVYLFSGRDLTLVARRKLDGSAYDSPYFVRQGTALLVSTYNSGMAWHAFAVPDLSPLGSFIPEGESVFLPANEMIAEVGRDGSILLRDPVSGVEKDKIALPIEWSDNVELGSLGGGRFLLVDNEKSLHLIEAATKLIHEIPRPEGDLHIDAYAETDPSGSRLFIRPSDNSVSVLEIETGKELYRFDGPVDRLREENPERAGPGTTIFFNSAVLGFAFSADGQQFALLHTTGRVQIRDVESGDLLAEIEAATQNVQVVAFLAIAGRIVTTSTDGSVRVFTYAKDVESYVADVRQSAPRCLSAQQRQDVFLSTTQPSWCGNR